MQAISGANSTLASPKRWMQCPSFRYRPNWWLRGTNLVTQTSTAEHNRERWRQEDQVSTNRYLPWTCSTHCNKANVLAVKIQSNRMTAPPHTNNHWTDLPPILHPLRRLVEPFITGHSVQVVKLLPDQANRSEQLLTPKDIPSLRIVLTANWQNISQSEGNS